MSDLIELNYRCNFFTEPYPAVELWPHDGKDLHRTVRAVVRGARAGSYSDIPSDEERNSRREADRHILFSLMQEMLNGICDHEIGRGNTDPALIEVYRQHLHEIDLGVIAASVSGEYGMPVEDVLADFWDWLGEQGPNMVANLVGAWLHELAGRGRQSETVTRTSGGTA